MRHLRILPVILLLLWGYPQKSPAQSPAEIALGGVNFHASGEYSPLVIEGPTGKAVKVQGSSNGLLLMSQGAGLVTSSTTTNVITSSTNIVLPTGTVQTTVYAPTGTDVYYLLGTGTASVTNGHTVYGGTARIIDVAAPGVNLALSGSGAKIVFDKQ